MESTVSDRIVVISDAAGRLLDGPPQQDPPAARARSGRFGRARSPGAQSVRLREKNSFQETSRNLARERELKNLNGFVVQQGSGSNFSIAGGKGNNQAWLIDGGNAQNVTLGNPTLSFDPPVEALQEFNVAISNYAAELHSSLQNFARSNRIRRSPGGKLLVRDAEPFGNGY